MNSFKSLLKKCYYSNHSGVLLRGSVKKFKELYPNRSKLIVCEVGVARGDNSENLLNLLDIGTLFCVDPYIPYVERDKMCLDHVNDKFFAQRRLRPFGDRVVFIYSSSVDAASEFMDGFFDLVYIDGNHNMCFEDMMAWFPKVKPGFMLAGHDVNHDKVFRDFLSFVELYDIDYFGVGDSQEQLHPDWWLIKK